MYYVAKVYKSMIPLIVEVFENLEDAREYADILTRTNKGVFTVLHPIDD